MSQRIPRAVVRDIDDVCGHADRQMAARPCTLFLQTVVRPYFDRGLDEAQGPVSDLLCKLLDLP